MDTQAIHGTDYHNFINELDKIFTTTLEEKTKKAALSFFESLTEPENLLEFTITPTHSKEIGVLFDQDVKMRHENIIVFAVDLNLKNKVKKIGIDNDLYSIPKKLFFEIKMAGKMLRYDSEGTPFANGIALKCGKNGKQTPINKTSKAKLSRAVWQDREDKEGNPIEPYYGLKKYNALGSFGKDSWIFTSDLRMKTPLVKNARQN